MSIARKTLNRLKHFASDQSGVVAIIFGLAAIPVIGLTGASLDYSRAADIQGELQGALDASVLSAAHQRDMTDAQVEAYMRAQIEAHMVGSAGAGSLVLNITRGGEDNLLVANATMRVDTTLLGIIGVHDIEVGVDSAVTADFASLEIAMVLDNTGSMRSSNRIGALRTAAQDFVDVVTEDGASDNVEIGIVPYTSVVNIGNQPQMHQYLDRDGLSEHHASLIEGQIIGRFNRPSCRNASIDMDIPVFDQEELQQAQAPSSWQIPGFFQMSFLDAYGDAINEMIGVTPAHAATPYTYIEDGCYVRNPDQISNWNLYEQMPGVDWKGCVEARPEPFDVTDDAASDHNPDTLWVPSFWIDDAARYWWMADNDWFSQDLPHVPSTDMRTDYIGRTYSIMKYDVSRRPDIDETPNGTQGPNKNCGDPILPLTNNFSSLEDHISGMTYWSGGGTVTAQGVVWGWRVLSPGHPFTEGEPYGETKKVMIVMTDGNNELVSSSNPATLSHYSAYGHVRTGRFPQETIASGLAYINARTLAACTNAKAAGIIVYTVTFGLNSSGRALWDQCATEPEMAYHVDSSSELIGAFNDIADSVGELRLTR